MTDITIIGAGIAGLTLGERLVRRGFQVDIVEIDESVGGLAKSFYYKDYVFDIGPHRFFTEDKTVLGFIRGILGDDYAIIPRSSGVYFYGRYCGWPLRPGIIFKLPIVLTFKVLRDLLSRRRFPGDSFEEYILKKYGKAIYETFFKDYTIKFLQQHPSAIHLDWATAGIERAIIDQKTEFTDLPTLIKRSIMPGRTKTEFIYPTVGGIGEFPRRLAKEIEKYRGVIKLKTVVKDVKIEDGKIIEVSLSDGSRHKPDLVIWTAPVDILCRLIGIEETRLKYLSMLLFNIEIRGTPPVPYQWCYYGQKNIVFNRVSIPRNFYHLTSPPDGTGLCVEVTCVENDRVWQNPEGLTATVTKDMIKVGLISSPDDIQAIHIEKVSNVYPIYELSYKEHLKRTTDKLAKLKNLRLLGRSGTFWYNNMDNSIDVALKMADEIKLNGADK